MGGRLPDFLGLGVQKGGTTTLHRLLERHPSVFLPPVKEVHYFSLHFGEGEAWYAISSPLLHRSSIVERSPYYLFIPRCRRGCMPAAQSTPDCAVA